MRMELCRYIKIRGKITDATRRARTILGTGRSDATTDLAHARRRGPTPPYGAQCPKWGPAPAGMAPWYNFFKQDYPDQE